MKTDKQDAAGRRQPYNEAFKRDAVRLVAEKGYSFKAAASPFTRTIRIVAV